jgi:hypothetical protein
MGASFLLSPAAHFYMTIVIFKSQAPGDRRNAEQSSLGIAGYHRAPQELAGEIFIGMWWTQVAVSNVTADSQAVPGILLSGR